MIHIVNASYSLSTVADAGEMDAKLEGIAGREADARGIALTTRQRDLSWDCGSETAALSLSKKLERVRIVTVEIIEIED